MADGSGGQGHGEQGAGHQGQGEGPRDAVLEIHIGRETDRAGQGLGREVLISMAAAKPAPSRATGVPARGQAPGWRQRPSGQGMGQGVPQREKVGGGEVPSLALGDSFPARTTVHHHQNLMDVARKWV